MPDTTIVQNEKEREALRRISAASRQPPAKIIGYDVLEFLGQGAFGEVWKALDRRNDCYVAVKYYTTRRETDWALLIREVEKLQFLANDQCVVRLWDVGHHADPPYYVMEFMENGSLEAILHNHGHLNLEETLRIGQEVAKGLVHAHNRGVLHCDLKPGNVLLDANNNIRLADFGQARLTSDKTPALGTFFYMAPEQADLDAEPDARWDVYAFGALMYRMLTGKAPFSELLPALSNTSDPNLRARLDRYRGLIQQSPAPAEHRSVEDMDRPLADIISKCLHVDPIRRYPNIQSVMAALNDRRTRQARRPLLILGGVLPLLIIICITIVGIFVWRGLAEATTEQLIGHIRQVSEFAAKSYAEQTASIVETQWRIAEQLAENPQFLEEMKRLQNLDEHHDPPLHRTDAGKKLQDIITAFANENRNKSQIYSYTLFNNKGVQIARHPIPKSDSLGTAFRYREYFHGQGRKPNTYEGAPITRPHLSIIYRSVEPGKPRMVGFSVPIMEDSPENPQIPQIPQIPPVASGNGVKDAKTAPQINHFGVLLLTVLVKDVFTLGKSNDSNYNPNLVPVWVDRREDTDGDANVILSHPMATRKGMAENWETHVYKIPPEDFPVDSRTILWNDNYHDPLGDAPELPNELGYSGRWLAASCPVILSWDHMRWNSGWSVIVQQRYEAVGGPIQELQKTMIRGGLRALTATIVLVALIWTFVGEVLNPLNRAGWVRKLRRQIGLSSRSTLNGVDTSSDSVSGSARTNTTIGPVRPADVRKEPKRTIPNRNAGFADNPTTTHVPSGENPQPANLPRVAARIISKDPNAHETLIPAHLRSANAGWNDPTLPENSMRDPAPHPVKEAISPSAPTPAQGNANVTEIQG